MRKGWARNGTEDSFKTTQARLISDGKTVIRKLMAEADAAGKVSGARSEEASARAPGQNFLAGGELERAIVK